MASLKPLIAASSAAGHLSLEKWEEQLGPLAEQLPKVASPEADAIATLWASDTMEIDPAARTRMSDFLVSRGYPMPGAGLSSYAKPSPALLPSIIEGNVTTPDAVFEHLVVASGRHEAKTLIAVLDNGVDVAHPALAEKVRVNSNETAGDGVDNDGNGKVDDVQGWNFVENNALPQPAGVMSSHGTHVAGLATQGTDRVELIPLRVVDYNTHGKRVADAIDYAVSQGARVINMSLSVQSDLELAREAVLRHPHVLFVVSAGNAGASLDKLGPDEMLQTNELPNMVVVGASGSEDMVATYSNRGAKHVDVAAHGQSLSSAPGGYDSQSGTSMAAPVVTSVAAKCLALDPTLNPATLKTLLDVTSRPAEAWKGQAASGGIVDDVLAMKLAAVRGLVTRGSTPQAAAEQLGLSGPERTKVLALLERVPPTTHRPIRSTFSPR